MNFFLNSAMVVVGVVHVSSACLVHVEELMFSHLAMGKHVLNLLFSIVCLSTPLSEGWVGQCACWSDLGGCVHMVGCGGQVTGGVFMQDL